MYYILTACSTFMAYVLWIVCERQLQEENKGDFKDIFRFNRQRAMLLGIYLVSSLGLVKVFSLYGYSPTKIVKYMILLGGLVPIAYEDTKEKRIPNRWLLYLCGLRLLLFGAESFLYPSAIVENLKFTLSGGAVCGVLLLLACIISRQQIGMGDVKLFAVIGLYLGTGVTYCVLLASLILAAVYTGVKLLRKKIGKKDEIAFGPFIMIGTLLITALGF